MAGVPGGETRAQPIAVLASSMPANGSSEQVRCQASDLLHCLPVSGRDCHLQWRLVYQSGLQLLFCSPPD